MSYTLSGSRPELFAHSVSESEIIGYYSIDGERNYLPNSSTMSYYKPPELGKVYMDLNRGIESAISRDYTSCEGSIDEMLKWITLNKTKILASKMDKWIEPEIVASGGLLKRLLCTPYLGESSWIICAAKLKGTIYLSRFTSEGEQLLEKAIPRKFSAWGYKFEQYIVSDSPDQDPDTSRPVVEDAEFRCVFRRRFGNHDVLFNAEMDAVRSEVVLKDPLPLKQLKFVELKTKKILSFVGQIRLFQRNNILQWWAQNFVTGIEETLCGFRDEDGIVRELKLFTNDELIEQGQLYWDPNVCIKFLQDFLDSVKKIVVKDYDRLIYKFEKVPNREITVTRVTPPSSFDFLRSSFVAKTD